MARFPYTPALPYSFQFSGRCNTPVIAGYTISKQRSNNNVRRPNCHVTLQTKLLCDYRPNCHVIADQIVT